jgi:hypothetical protein
MINTRAVAVAICAAWLAGRRSGEVSTHTHAQRHTQHTHTHTKGTPALNSSSIACRRITLVQVFNIHLDGSNRDAKCCRPAVREGSLALSPNDTENIEILRDAENGAHELTERGVSLAPAMLLGIAGTCIFS